MFIFNNFHRIVYYGYYCQQSLRTAIRRTVTVENNIQQHLGFTKLNKLNRKRTFSEENNIRF